MIENKNVESDDNYDEDSNNDDDDSDIELVYDEYADENEVQDLMKNDEVEEDEEQPTPQKLMDRHADEVHDVVGRFDEEEVIFGDAKDDNNSIENIGVGEDQIDPMMEIAGVVELVEDMTKEEQRRLEEEMDRKYGAQSEKHNLQCW